ncbi:hypothetical protein MVEN_00807100 [Mycena venus]|uniref:Uncharacterized protein n=1 Tax=Mycena venus TaxID=2733690 RepID=A0A8H6YL77_9AGAR|nr:hypothetical protein MVEN_00807100 [Mycena venus]
MEDEPPSEHQVTSQTTVNTVGHAPSEWKNDADRYSSLRHPSLMQIYAVASATGVHAAVFNDDLIPFKQFLEVYRRSHLLTVYIHAHCDTEFMDAHTYLSSLFAKSVFPEDCSVDPPLNRAVVRRPCGPDINLPRGVLPSDT